MNRLSVNRQAEIVHHLVEGNSIRATCRLTDSAKNTVVKLLLRVGKVCSIFQDKAMVNLPCKRIQCDEIWSFVGCKEKQVPKELKRKGIIGDVWTWVALCLEFKLVPCWLVGPRDASTAYHFMHDLTRD